MNVIQNLVYLNFLKIEKFPIQTQDQVSIWWQEQQIIMYM